MSTAPSAVPSSSVRRVVVIGGGVTGCVLAERLKERWPSAQVVLLEGSSTLGGLSVRSEPDDIGWDRFYHVVTPQDRRLVQWLGRLGMDEKLRWKSARTGFFSDGTLHAFNTPLDFLRFPPLNLVEKARLGATILYASRITDGKPLESITAAAWLRKLAGDSVYQKIWEPLLRAKLGSAHEEVAASFIWSTIRRLYATREGEGKTEAFGYISGGYAPVFARAEDYLTARGITVRKSARVERLARSPEDGTLQVLLAGGETLAADRVIFTGPSRVLPTLCRDLNVEPSILERARSQRYLGVICMVLRLRAPSVLTTS
jgi:protoporphyrinogen oxidase